MDLDDKKFMQSPQDWPLGNVCPVKQVTGRTTKPKFGFLVTADGTTVEPIIYDISYEVIGNRFSVKKINQNELEMIAEEGNPRTGGDKLPATEIARFPSFEAMVAAGWIVD